MKRGIATLILAGALVAPASAGAQTPVKADLEATQSGGKVTFDASRSTGAADYQWDLDGDGTFEVDSGATPTTSEVVPPGATVIATVKVTDATGASDQATAHITVDQAPGPHVRSGSVEAPASAPAKPAPKVVAAAASGVTIKDFSFGPKTVTIDAGDSITWTNQGPTGHSTTARGGAWDSGVLPAGKSFSHTFTQPGTYQYFCKPHPFMTATIVVKAASSSSGSGSGSSGSGSGSGSTGSTGTGTGTTGTSTTATPAATANDPNSLPKTGGDPFPWVALGASLIAFGAALRWRLRAE